MTQHMPHIVLLWCTTGPIGYGDDEYMIEFGYIPVTPAQLRPIALGGKAALIRSVMRHT